METRKGKPGKALSESEIEEIQARLNAKEAQLREQANLFQQQREEFESKKLSFERDVERIKISLDDREAELSKRADSAHDQEQPTGRHILIGPDTVHDGEGKTASVHPHVHGGNALPLYDANVSTIYSPPDYGHEYGLPRISFKEALESVPYFDGANISLTQFTRACRRARDIIPPSGERSLTRLLQNKLRGRAHLAVLDEPCDSVAQLIDILIGAFGVHKTIDQYRGELSTTFKKSNEHMIEYIGRIKEMRGQIIDAEQRRRGALSPEITREIDALTARSFCDGLPFEYSSLLKSEHYANPFEAFNYVKIIAKRKELDKERLELTRQGGRPIERYVHPIGKPLAQSTPAKTYDQGAYRGRDIAPRSPVDQPPAYGFRGQWNRPNVRLGWDDRRQEPNRNPLFCRYCKTPGHNIDECRKRQYNNNHRSQGNPLLPPREKDEPRAGTPKPSERPVRAIAETPSEPESLP